MALRPPAGWFTARLIRLPGLSKNLFTARHHRKLKLMSTHSFRVLVLAENGGHHVAYSQRAKLWLDDLAETGAFTVDYLHNTDTLDEVMLAQYRLVIQLDYPPYGWPEKAARAFERYIETGQGGWLGFHHASLLGEFDGFPMWDWFSQFLGDIRYDNYIATFAEATVTVEDSVHPVMQGVPASFPIAQEEWYTYNRSPRPNVRVLAHVDEDTYTPDSLIKMGDHPVVWSNENVTARNLYIFMGHAPQLFDQPAYSTLVRNAIFWAAGR